MVWRKQNTEFELKNLKDTDKHGGDSVWGCMAANGVSDLVLTDGIIGKKYYLNILRGHLSLIAAKLQLESNHYFQHDNDPKHTAYIVKQWVLCNTLHVLPIPHQSPDVNLIENLWVEIERRLKKFEITNKEILKEKVVDIWNTIEKKYTKKLVKSMADRLRSIIRYKERPTKY